MKWLLTTLILLCMNGQTIMAVGEMPIIAYMGVPNNRSTDENFKDFKDCGFNVSLYGYASLQQLTAACEVAQKYGVRILGHCPETHESPKRAASILKDNKGFFGYVLQDEPSASDIRELQKEIAQLATVDNKHCFYINLLPFYDNWILRYTKTATYSDYLDAATATSCRQISFDYYPITHKGLRNGWYNNLEQIRHQSIKAKIPFWGFVLSVPHAMYPQPDLGSLRLQVYSNLAYGAQAIQYFTYWTPQPEGENNYHNGPIDINGQKTETYYLVQKMNRELRIISKVFYGAKIISVNHLGKTPKGTTRPSKLPLNIKSLKVTGKRGIIVSQLENKGITYLALVNKDYTHSARVDIQPRNQVPKHLSKSLVEEPMNSSYVVNPGDLLLFKLN